ncbi:hypothetical protein [Pseudosulfitobacter pseudonitzschiae]|nr:hypothetical protein [Pseudosulfitobacter pseudonitzschiae]MBM2043331.1 hypothetical protein [Pseudosulfitobacter pseudonitzschiae]MBM2120898.1 hypothetical protein [Pseudosulfitobacter pseudonitzschiae]MBM2164326.1 hypothetical protein [Pseudosulfitobacter pseudonitzschiae]MBM2265799.1 hypothetical protein [Pseudosulfitobacter pseudonitzschiae]MCA0138607.1 hypothetical protein [Pseudosulfitobacter pseudonitzschiae]
MAARPPLFGSGPINAKFHRGVFGAFKIPMTIRQEDKHGFPAARLECRSS